MRCLQNVWCVAHEQQPSCRCTSNGVGSVFLGCASMYSLSYFSIQMAFAKRAGQALGLPCHEAVRLFTSYATTLQGAGLGAVQYGYREPSRVMARPYYECYLRDRAPSEGRGPFGCFRYDYDSLKEQVLIRFSGGADTLAVSARTDRSNELRKMFAYIKVNQSGARSVKGFSWLYNLSVYADLFPPMYIAQATVVAGWFRSGALWGQVARGDGRIRPNLTRAILSGASKATNISDLDGCFAHRVLTPLASIDEFYRYYGLR